MLEGTVRDPNFAVDFSQLADMSEVSRLDVSTDVVHYIAATTPFGEGSKRALVAGSDIVYGMARLYGTVAEQRPGEFRAFREMSSAIEWLGLQDDEHAIRETIASLPPLAISE